MSDSQEISFSNASDTVARGLDSAYKNQKNTLRYLPAARIDNLRDDIESLLYGGDVEACYEMAIRKLGEINASLTRSPQSETDVCISTMEIQTVFDNLDSPSPWVGVGMFYNFMWNVTDPQLAHAINVINAGLMVKE